MGSLSFIHLFKIGWQKYLKTFYAHNMQLVVLDTHFKLFALPLDFKPVFACHCILACYLTIVVFYTFDSLISLKSMGCLTLCWYFFHVYIPYQII